MKKSSMPSSCQLKTQLFQEEGRGVFERSWKKNYLIDKPFYNSSSCPTYSSTGTRDCTSNNAADWVLNVDICVKV